MSNASAQPSAAWYEDPSDSSQLRWWDGAQWSHHTQPKVVIQAPAPVTASVQVASPVYPAQLTVDENQEPTGDSGETSIENTKPVCDASRKAMRFGLISLLISPVGFYAVFLGYAARKKIAESNGNLFGVKQAFVGLVCGYVAVILTIGALGFGYLSYSSVKRTFHPKDSDPKVAMSNIRHVVDSYNTCAANPQTLRTICLTNSSLTASYPELAEPLQLGCARGNGICISTLSKTDFLVNSAASVNGKLIDFEWMVKKGKSTRLCQSNHKDLVKKLCPNGTW